MQRIEVRTPFEQVGEAFEQLANAVGPDRITFLWDRPVAIGEFVGFRIGLADGTPVLEGGGTCAELIDLGPESPRPGRYRLVLSTLELDALNRRSLGRILDGRIRARESRRPESMAPRRPLPSVIPARPTTTPPRVSGAPLAPAPAPRRTPSNGAPARDGVRVFGRPSEAPGRGGDLHDAPTVVAPLPVPAAATKRPSTSPSGGYTVPRPPPLPSLGEEEPLELLVPRTLVARAEALLPRLAGTQGLPSRELSSPDTLLRHALRMGIAALEAQAEAADAATAGD